MGITHEFETINKLRLNWVEEECFLSLKKIQTFVGFLNVYYKHTGILQYYSLIQRNMPQKYTKIDFFYIFFAVPHCVA